MKFNLAQLKTNFLASREAGKLEIFLSNRTNSRHDLLLYCETIFSQVASLLWSFLTLHPFQSLL